MGGDGRKLCRGGAHSLRGEWRARAGAGVFPVLLAVLSTSGYFVIQKSYLKRYRALEFAAYSVWAGTLLSLVFSPGFVSGISAASAGATILAVYLGVFPTAIAYALYRLPPSPGRGSAHRKVEDL